MRFPRACPNASALASSSGGLQCRGAREYGLRCQTLVAEGDLAYPAYPAAEAVEDRPYQIQAYHREEGEEEGRRRILA